MSLPIDPQGTYRVYLKADADVTEAQRPYFVFRRMNGREWRRVAELSEGYTEKSGIAESLDRVYEAVKIGMVAWHHKTDPATGAEVAYNPDDLDLVLDPIDAQEVIGAKMASGRVSIPEKKG